MQKETQEERAAHNVCFGFEVHQPFRLNRHFSPDPKVKKNDLPALYFDELNKEVLERVSEKCYVPATLKILEKLDEGFRCAFSFSGTLIEQMEKWQPDVLSLFDAVSRHKNTELIGQTYYHSIAGCFGDKSEFIEQAKMHTNLMYDLFKTRPTVFENTEFTFNNQIATLVKEMGYTGIFTEGVDRILGWRSPHHIYTCNDLPVLLRDVQLSDDIAFRFANRGWDKYPLTADTYAGWLSGTQGDVTNIFLDYETFGEHFWEDTGIFNFLSHLPGELKNCGVKTVLPTEVLLKYPPVGTIDVHDTISWADIEKDASAWMGNERQHTAYSAVQKAAAFAKDKSIWRYLQTSDHFYYMASKYGTCGEVHNYFSHHEADDAFRTYMAILADFERRNIRVMKNRGSAKTLRTLSPDEAFHFTSPGGYVGYAAYSLDQFCDLLRVVPGDSIAFHQGRGDIANWIMHTLDDKRLAENIRECTDRQALLKMINERRELLWSHLT
ncbi:MAG: alpha-amylase [Methanoregula sp.]|nr:alpha-amylase [Methanoregula sp.]